ncbi:MAG: hypothetical protein ABIQ74_10630 [Chitinophagales bacterium]
MKYLFTFLFLALLSFHGKISAQTKILDSKVDWTAGDLTLYLSDSLATSVSVQLGTSFQANDVYNSSSLFLGIDLPLSNTIVIHLTNVTPGIYYVDVKVNGADNNIEEMEFQTTN